VNPPMNRLLAFYLGSHPDHQGRMLAEILKQDDLWLELTHDFIQWLFPLREVSRVNRNAPLVDNATARFFREDALLQRHLMAAYLRMLAFYGLQRQADGEVQKGQNWHERKPDWFTEDSHNSLRITRMLKCLTDLGLAAEARSFHRALSRLCAAEADCDIDPTSQDFWRDAVLELPAQ
jgi:Opioid growth factor receptor (OGFr) conserved region